METRQLWHKELEDDQTPDQAEGRPKRSFANQSVGRQPDPFRRQQVERAAVEETTRHFTSNGYVVESAETDNVGWDLEAVRGRIKLRLEVKGLSGPDVSVELTPNEYKKMQEYRDSYWLCVVTDALTAPKLTMFAYSKQAGRWEDQDGRPLAIEEVAAARCRAVWN